MHACILTTGEAEMKGLLESRIHATALKTRSEILSKKRQKGKKRKKKKGLAPPHSHTYPGFFSLVLTLDPFSILRLILRFLEGSRSVSGSEICYSPIHSPFPLYIQVTEGICLFIYLFNKGLTCIEFFCLAYNDKCQNCRLFSLII